MSRIQRGEIVIAKVKEIRQHSVLVDILDHPGKEGMIHISEIASGWVKNIRNHVKVGQIVVCKVVSLSKSHVGLSMKRLTEREKKEKIKKFNLEKRAEKIFEFMKKSGLKESDKSRIISEFGSLWSCFETAVKKPEMVRKRLPDMAETIIEVASKNIKRKSVEMRYIIRIRSSEPNGIEIIKAALAPLERKYDIMYVSAGEFLLKHESDSPKKAEKEITEALERLVKGKGYAAEYSRL